MLLRLVDDEFLQAGASRLAGEVHVLCLLFLACGAVALLLALAELGPRHGFGAVARLFGDIYAEILSRPTSPYRTRV